MPRILVVDDDLDILVVMEILLGMKGFEVDITAKWDNFFDTISTFKPDLILLDVLISGNDGRTLCKKLKSRPGTRQIPVIMFSAHPAAEEDIKDCGADDFIAKPFEVNDLLQKINSQLKANSL